MKTKTVIGALCALGLFVAACSSAEKSTTTEVRVADPRPVWFGDKDYVTTSVPVKQAEPAPAAKPAAKPAPMPSRGACMYYPTGERASSALQVCQVMPAEVRAGQPFSYDIEVVNLTSGELQNVVVTEQNTDNLNITGSNPQGSKNGQGMWQWALGSMKGGEREVIKVNATAPKVGMASNCLTVSYNSYLCASTSVIQPAIQLTKRATPEVMECDMIVLTYEVKNTGSGMAEGIVIRDTLPAGLTVDGKSSVELPVGALASNQTATREVRAKASKPGRYESQATATASGDLTAKSESPATVVKKPVLALDAKCPGKTFVGRDMRYEFSVKNSGDGASASTRLSCPLPAGTQFAGASDNGTVVSGAVVWNLGTLAPGASKSVNMTLRASAIGDYKVAPYAEGACAAQVRADCSTVMAGIPAILLEVVDNPDPVEVGTNTTYTIVVTNQGSAPDSGIKIVCELPAEIDLVSAGGATQGTGAGRTVTFAPLASLAPGARATWSVVVKANKEGDIRFKTSMTSNQFTRPVEETEATNLYR